MKSRKRHYHRSKQKFKNRYRAPRIPKIKPGADAKLKKIFSTIGVPRKTAFKPDPFQIRALSAINRSDCLVTAPTGAGKTWIAEQAIARVRETGGRSWYASPLKALSNSIYGLFSGIFGNENVGILTGDRKENPDAPIIVGTTEILRNQLYDAMHAGESLSADLVVLDEAHFLGDEDRGVVWEEIMIYLPNRIPLLLLSATIGNAKQIARWLSSIRSKECIVVEDTQRPVPLFPLFFHPSGTLLPLMVKRGPGKKDRIYKKVDTYIKSKRPPILSPSHKLPPFDEILRVLRKYRLLPAIFFLKSRADCDHALDRCANNLIRDPSRKEMLSRRIDELVAQNRHAAGHRQRWQLEHLAVGSHHSGQLPSWKLVLETLMTEGLLDAVFATSTVAAGVNFPARTILFLNSDRFNGREFLPLSPTEFHQMTGRAGRRGKDNIGFAVAIPGKFMDLRLAAKLTSSSPSAVTSQININFSMVLNLLLSHTPDQIKDLLKKSFATYTIIESKKRQSKRKRGKNGQDHLWQDFLLHLDFLQKTGYVTKNGELTDDGKWASRLRVDQPLMIAEGFRLGVFPDADPALLAAVIGSFVNEQESEDRGAGSPVSDTLYRSFLQVTQRLAPFAQRMTDNGFYVRPLYFRPAVTMHAWATRQSWEKVLAIAEIEEGDLAMLILRTADNLRHIRPLAHVFPEAAKSASKAIDAILRDPVVVEY